jgi:hypothetical protein
MKILILFVTLTGWITANAQSTTEKINKELRFEKVSPSNALILANIDGDVTIEGYNGTTVVVEVEKVITAKTEERMKKGLQEMQLGIIDRADTLLLYIEGTCQPFGRSKKYNGGKWGYQWVNCENDHHEYDFTFRFRIKVPNKINIEASTINNGNVSIQNVLGKVIASNVNGGITLKNVVESVNAHTVNGDVDVEYAKNPSSDCRFYTLNGDINAFFQKGLAADVAFESYNGDFYTNLEKLESLPMSVEKAKNENGTRYKLNRNRFKAGAGGVLLDFETFNGNVYLKER